ncbi:hypothetical protein MAC_04051 [Metarhizium acridum CQMa 102]|uniref:BZIP domain-containing protein n=1 Tax=Metarhizium acridum (strain CQMa 102) TaxID=655827 RepID=E9E2F3_METAQ|nr:uncharacterized protein MAC_04051 [Metarhizium acridum CQMa 102]EFY89842.1 hypothetical protein MAC_04051 [Metarhizium acridum CQMa 102]
MANVKQQDQSASAIRIRDNQRRSRARRKEYVENLERKVQEYERRGVEATLEMQQAARTVAVENSRLKMMLASLGVSEGDVDDFLAACQDREAAEALSSVSMRPVHHDQRDDESSRDVQAVPRQGMSSGKPYPHPQSVPGNHQYAFAPGGHTGSTSSSSYSSAASRQHTPLDVLASATLQQNSCCEGKTRCTTAASEAPSPSTVETNTRAVTPTSSPDAAGLVQGFSSPMEMSCSAAAAIIAEMQGHGDMGTAKARLGCRAQQECLVKNAMLFQILESEARGNFS